MKRRTAHAATHVVVHGEHVSKHGSGKKADEEHAELEVTLSLTCGCTVRRHIAKDRVQETLDGQQIAVGKYVCEKHSSM